MCAYGNVLFVSILLHAPPKKASRKKPPSDCVKLTLEQSLISFVSAASVRHHFLFSQDSAPAELLFS